MTATRGIVCTPHHVATEAGAQMLRDGGNAIDAAIAADAVLCVVYPHMTSVGGDLFALVWPEGRSAPVGLEGAGRSGSLATIDAVRHQGWESMPERGALTVTVPGTVSAWGRLLEGHGTFGLAHVLEPAIHLARHGWIVTENLAGFLAGNFEWLSPEPEAARLLPPLKAGMLMRNPDLAASLEEIGRNGILNFYRGDIAAAIVTALAQRGGLLTAEDLAMHRAEWVEPVAFPYGDLTVYEMPPPTQGLAAAGMIRRLERLPAADLRPGPALARAVYRFRDQVYAMRDRWISDPAFTDVPSEPFLDPDAALAGGDPLPEGDTIYLCTADARGNTVSLIQSVANSFGSGIFAEGTGILLHNRGLYFSLDFGHVNRLEPRKKTMHTLIPAMAARDGRCWAAFGSMGADGQPMIQSQVFVNLATAGMEPEQAVAAPRVRVRPGGGELWAEADYPGATQLRGDLQVVLHPARSTTFGHAQALVWDGPSAWRGGADPRSDGSVEAV